MPQQGWKPPDYSTPVWKPPDYATPVEEPWYSKILSSPLGTFAKNLVNPSQPESEEEYLSKRTGQNKEDAINYAMQRRLDDPSFRLGNVKAPGIGQQIPFLATGAKKLADVLTTDPAAVEREKHPYVAGAIEGLGSFLSELYPMPKPVGGPIGSYARYNLNSEGVAEKPIKIPSLAAKGQDITKLEPTTTPYSKSELKYEPAPGYTFNEETQRYEEVTPKAKVAKKETAPVASRWVSTPEGFKQVDSEVELNKRISPEPPEKDEIQFNKKTEQSSSPWINYSVNYKKRYTNDEFMAEWNDLIKRGEKVGVKPAEGSSNINKLREEVEAAEAAEGIQRSENLYPDVGPNKKTNETPSDAGIPTTKYKAPTEIQYMQSPRVQAAFEAEIAHAEELGINTNKYRGMQLLRKAVKEVEANKKTGAPISSEVQATLKKDEAPPEEGIEQAVNRYGRAVAGTNVRNSIEELTKGYSQPLPAVMVRESLQNALDVTKDMPDGHVTAEINGKEKSIKVTDNGPGMNDEQLAIKLLDVAESGKTNDPNATGGKGVGSASYLYGGKKVEVSSVTNEGGQKVRYFFEGDPETFLDHEKGVEIRKEVMSNSTPTGTTIKTYLTSEQRIVDSQLMLNNIKEHSRDLKPKFTFSTGSELKSIDGNFSAKNGDNIFFDGPLDQYNDASFSIPKNAKASKENYLPIKVLNNGMYQFKTEAYLGSEKVDIKQPVIVDIRPKVRERENGYPFPTSRDELKYDVKNKVETLIREKYANPALESGKVNLAKLYAALPTIDAGPTNRKTFLFDPGNRLTPEESKLFRDSPFIKSYVKVADEFLAKILDAPAFAKERDRLEGVGIVLDPNSHGLHIPNPVTGKSVIGLNPFIHMKYNDLANAARKNVVTIVHEAAHIGKEAPLSTVPFNPSTLEEGTMAADFYSEYIKHVIEETGQNAGHGIDFIKRLGDVVQRTPAKDFNEVIGKIEDIFTGNEGQTKPKYVLTPDKGWVAKESPTRINAGELSPEAKKLLSIYKERERREGTTEDLLSPTGVKSEFRPGGKESSGGNDQSDEEASLNSGIQKLVEGIKTSGPLRQEQEQSYSEERSARVTAGMSEWRKNPSFSGFKKGMQQLKGPLEKVEPENRYSLDNDETDAIFKFISQNKYLTPFEKFRTGLATLKLMEGHIVPQNSELNLLRSTFGNELPDSAIQRWSSEQGFIKGDLLNPITRRQVMKGVNTAKSLMASTDFSAPLRQGLPLIYTKQWWAALKPMFKSAFSEEFFQGLQESLVDRPKYQLGREAGLHLSFENLNAREEAFLGSYAEQIPIMGRIVRGSDRAYTGFLNKLRADTFDSLIDNYKDYGGQDLETLARGAAKFVNVATGRGSLGSLNKMANELNAVMFSPRLIASRLTMLNPRYYLNLPKGIRQEAVKSLFAVAGTGSIIAAFAKGLGADVSVNPTNSDFGKIRIGNTRIDPYAGFQQYITAATRLLSGRDQSSQTERNWRFPGLGDVGLNVATGGGYKLPKVAPKSPTALSVISDFAEYKTSPLASLVWTLLRGQTKQGGPLQITPTMGPPAQTGEIAKRYIPLLIQDLYDVAQDNPKLLPLTALAGTFGMGVQTYGNKPASPIKVRGMGIGMSPVR